MSSRVRIERERRIWRTLAGVSQALAASPRVADVARSIVEGAKDLLHARFAYLRGHDARTGELAEIGRVDAGDDLFIVGVLPRGAGVMGLAVREENAVATSDMLADPRVWFPAPLRERLAAAPYGSVLAVPLVARHAVVGCFAVCDAAGRRWTDEEIALAQAFADQAALAFEAARLFEASERRQREAMLLADLGRRLSEDLDADAAGQRMVDAVGQLLGGTSTVLYRLGEEGTLVATKRSTGAPGVRPRLPVLPNGHGVVGVALRERRPAWSSDALSDPHVVYTEAARRDLEASEDRAFLAVPLAIAGDAFGVLLIADTTGREFTVAEARLAQAFADHAALAIHNAELFAREQAARREAEESQQRAHEFFEDLPIGLFRTTPEGRYLAVNSALVTAMGYPDAATLLRTNATAIYVDPADRDRWRSLIDDGDTVAGVEFAFRRHDGSTGWGRNATRALHDLDGDVIAYEGTFEDITDQRRTTDALRDTEEQVRQLQKMEALGRLAAGVAHDFNNLLTIIAGRAELLLLRRDLRDPNLQTNLGLIWETTKRAAELTRQLLAFSRKQVLQPRVLDLNAAITDMERMLRPVLGEDIELIIERDPAAGRVNADPTQIEQVVLNLVVNARDAMPTGGRLRIRTGAFVVDEVMARRGFACGPGRYAVLEIQDNGCGMDAATRDRIFDPFFTTKGPERGTGLGLSTVFGVVRQSGGDVRVYSEPGVGSTFTVLLPQVDAPAATGAGDTPARRRRGTETILLVEDERDVRNVAAEMLANAGYRVLPAGDGVEALRIAAREKVDLLLTDVIMPRMSGGELAAQFHARYPDARLLFASGFTDDILDQHGLHSAMATLLHKPYSFDDLLHGVRNALDAPAVSAAAERRAACGRATTC